ncbi:MAG: hypothetical protein ABJM11_07845 [Marinobacter sp.]|uniref:PaaI family thioesterase n=1 Tax=Marinobacter sp. TaxID=50741 RepID=UPI00329A477C
MLDNPFLALLGAELRKWEDGLCEWELEIAPHHLNTQGSLQGGVIATLLRIPANVTGHSGDRDRFAHGHHAGVSFVL